MGNCFSCLGHRNSDIYDEDDEARLLFDDPNNLQYGSFGEQVNDQEDPIEVQREVEALQRVVARTADNMVDIYEIAPQDKVPRMPVIYGYAEQEARSARYRSLLSKLSSEFDDSKAEATGPKVDWTPQNENPGEAILAGEERGSIELQLKTDDGSMLVGNFADAAAAMR